MHLSGHTQVLSCTLPARAGGWVTDPQVTALLLTPPMTSEDRRPRLCGDSQLH